MLKKVTVLLIVGLLQFIAIPIFGETVEIPLTSSPDPDGDSDPDDDPDDNIRRRRMPPARILCEIDFESGRIEGSSPLLADIQSYEIWTEEGEACLFAGATAGEMTATLSGLGEGVYMLKLRGAGYVLIGFIER